MNSFNLENGPKIKPGFKTPDNYFENFSEQMLARIDSNEKPVRSIFPEKEKLVYGCSGCPYNWTCNSFSKQACQQCCYRWWSLENYLAYQSTISQYDLINLLDKEDIEALESDLKIDDAVVESALSDNTNLENYLTE